MSNEYENTLLDGKSTGMLGPVILNQYSTNLIYVMIRESI